MNSTQNGAGNYRRTKSPNSSQPWACGDQGTPQMIAFYAEEKRVKEMRRELFRPGGIVTQADLDARDVRIAEQKAAEAAEADENEAEERKERR